MPKTTNRRRADAHPAEEFSDTIFDVFEGNQGEKPIAQSRSSSEPTVAELMERLGAVNAKLEAVEQERAFVQTPTVQAPAQVTLPDVPKLNLEGLPDPVTDAKGYGEAIATRTLAYQSEVQKYNQAKAEAANPKPLGDVNALWEDFTEAYPDYAENDARIRFATGEAVKRLAQRGVDVTRFMYQRPEQFFQAITQEFDSTFGDPTQELGELDDEEFEERPAPRRRRAQSEDDGDDGRAESIPGGQQGGVRPRGTETPPSDLISDLRAIQRKTGYF